MLWCSRRQRSFFIAFILPILILTQQPRAVSSEGSQLSPEQVVALSTKPAVVRIDNSCGAGYTYTYKDSTDTEKEIAGFFTYGGPGSGFFVNPNGYIITHAVKSESDCEAELYNQMVKYLENEGIEINRDNIKRSYFGYRRNVFLPTSEAGKAPSKEFEIERSGEPSGGRDIALIKVPLENAPVLKLADGTVELREQVSVVGYPIAADAVNVTTKEEFESENKGLSERAFSEASVVDGKISNPNQEVVDEPPVLQVDVLSGMGNAGSPVINSKGEVVGIIASTSSDRDFYSSSRNSSAAERGIPIAIPTSTIKEFTQSVGIKNEEGQTNVLFREGLTAFTQGDYENAKIKFEAVKELFEDHSEVDRLISQSGESLVDQVRRPPYLLLGVIMVVLLGLIGLILHFLKQEGSGKATTASAPDVPAQDLPDVPAQDLNGSSRPTNIDVSPYLELEYQGEFRYLTLQNDEHHIGRDASWSDVEIPDSWEVCSRRHATLKREGTGYRIYDGDGRDRSSNGLLCKDGTKVDASGHFLKDKNELIIGKNPYEQVTITYFEPASNHMNTRQTKLIE
jgi:Trypsin-like peptidase domain/FHA domain